MAKINIQGLRDIEDENYRYKMPSVEIKIEGRGNGIKTVLQNINDIAKSTKRSEEEIIKYISLSLGTQSKNNIINGSYCQQDIQKTLFKFIEDFVLCIHCHLPETFYEIMSNELTKKCNSCGMISILGNNKMIKLIISKIKEGVYNKTFGSDSDFDNFVSNDDDNIAEMSDESTSSSSSSSSSSASEQKLELKKSNSIMKILNTIELNFENKGTSFSENKFIDEFKELIEKKSNSSGNLEDLNIHNNSLNKILDLCVEGDDVEIIIKNIEENADELKLKINENVTEFFELFLQKMANINLISEVCEVFDYLYIKDFIEEDQFISWYKNCNKSIKHATDEFYEWISENYA